MSPSDDPSLSARKLMGNLTVEDGRHLVQSEGGPMGRFELAFRLASTIAIAGLLARAIEYGHATVWHLALPMIAQYFAVLLAVPIAYAIVLHPAMRRDALMSLKLLAIIAAILIATSIVRAWHAGVTWQEQTSHDLAAAWKWIADAKVHWPILLAFLAELLAMPGRVNNLLKLGPPFSGVSLGCGMRVVVVFLGFAALPWALGGGERMVWFLWSIIVLAELLALWMHWDIQRALNKLDRDAPSEAT